MTSSNTTPIGLHGVIGDLETLALVGNEARIEWLCWPRFDSPSVFGSLLDPDGGCWSIRPACAVQTERHLYLPDTNVLVTRFHTEGGVVEVEDSMAIASTGRGLVRRVLGVRGAVELSSDLVPRPDYGRANPELREEEAGVRISWAADSLLFRSGVDQDVQEDHVSSTFKISEGEEIRFSLGTDDLRIEDPDLPDRIVAFWRNWIEGSSYTGAWKEIVRRSALTLKLLTHEESGGMLAAGTTSLPEAIGGERNWDYRYVWIRDAAFTLYAFIELGFNAEANAFTEWLTGRLHREPDGSDTPPLRPLYDLDGNSAIEETTLDNWSGYRESAPVRVGNAASDQLQLDIFGELMDSLYLADKHGPGLSVTVWNRLRKLVDWVCDNWDQPDDGIWEVRSGPQRFTSSAVLCWVAVERAIRMANSRGRPANLERWHQVRDEIHDSVLERGWNSEMEAFTQTFEGDTIDASILLMPLVKFISPTDPQWLSTLAAVGEHLTHGALVDRYDNNAHDDGLEGDDGSFSICSFWYVEALARAGEIDRARLLFDKMLSYAGPLGLFSEVISPSGLQLGNYPQAFTHLSLISAAVHLNELLETS